MLNILKNLFSEPNDAKLQEALNNGAFLVDVRTPAEFSGGSARGAVNIPLDKIHTQLAKFKNKNTVVVFCRSGARSSQAKIVLEKAGLTHVINGGSYQQVIKAQQS
jgi:rhodanese-related sulfurtransferase